MYQFIYLQDELYEPHSTIPTINTLPTINNFTCYFILGNEALFSLETASDYVKDEKATFYGFKCFAVGYEFCPGPDEVSLFLSIANLSMDYLSYMKI